MTQKFKKLDDVTVFVLTTGESTLLECMAALRVQNSEFRLETVRNVSPMNAALQAILDRCDTKYYVQVDADMILNSNAIARLHRAIEAEAEDVFQVVIALQDEHLRKDILGVRIVKTEIAKKYPLRPVQGCEVDQIRRAAEDGYRVTARIGKDIEPIGVHRLQPTMRAIFERYRTLFRRARAGEGIEWVNPYAREFARRFAAHPTAVNLYAVLGAVAGALSPLDTEEGEKDTSKVPEELLALYALFGEGDFK